MSIFTKEEKLNIDPKTKKSKWITTKKGISIPSIARKQPSALDLKVKQFQKKQRAIRKTARQAKVKHYKKKWSNIQDVVGRNINPDLLSMGSITPSSSPVHKKKKGKKKGKPQYILRGGIAYKIAGTGKKKKKKKKPQQDDSGWIDPFNMDIGGGLF